MRTIREQKVCFSDAFLVERQIIFLASDILFLGQWHFNFGLATFYSLTGDNFFSLTTTPGTKYTGKGVCANLKIKPFITIILFT
jgi:hypothetical protein